MFEQIAAAKPGFLVFPASEPGDALPVVEESDGDLMGDGVNIAARLEGVGKPGAICLSEQAYWRGGTGRGRRSTCIHC